MNSVQYYFIKDLKRLGKIDGSVPFLYDPDAGWTVDGRALLMDRVIGYDGERIGATSMLTRVDDITEAEALAFIESLQH